MLVSKHTITAIIGEMSAKSLARLFQNNIWKLYNLPKYIIFDRKSQFVTELMKKLNRLETRAISTVLYRLQTKKLAGMVSNDRVCSKQQDIFSN